MEYNNKEINRLLNGKRRRGEEDLLIQQSDGSRACAGWELNKKGYHLDKPRVHKELTDEELLQSAYRELEKRKMKR
jgi:hypothetical protein